MLRRLHPDQPDTFAFAPANQAWAEVQITKFPDINLNHKESF